MVAVITVDADGSSRLIRADRVGVRRDCKTSLCAALHTISTSALSFAALSDNPSPGELYHVIVSSTPESGARWLMARYQVPSLAALLQLEAFTRLRATQTSR